MFFWFLKNAQSSKEGLMNLTYPNPSTTMKICLQLEECWTKFKLAAQAVQDSTKCIAGIKELGLFKVLSENNFPIGNPPFKGIYREYWGIYRESIFSQILENIFFFVWTIGPPANPKKSRSVCTPFWVRRCRIEPGDSQKPCWTPRSRGNSYSTPPWILRGLQPWIKNLGLQNL